MTEQTAKAATARNRRADLALRTPDTGRTSTNRARAHTRRVRRLRLIVPAVGAGLLATYALSATPSEVDRQFLREFANIETEGRNMRLNKPRHTGYDLEGNPFEVAAASAERAADTPDLVSLENPEAMRGFGEGEELRVRARQGLMNTRTKRLDLTDDVELDHRLGGSDFSLATPAAEVDFENQVVTSTGGIVGTGERGTVAADSLTAYQGEGRVVLEGNVKLRLKPNAAEDATD